MIKVVRDTDELNRQVWWFYYDDRSSTLRISGYKALIRPTKRHKYTLTKSFHPAEQCQGKMKQADVPLPDDVAAEALQQFVAKLRVVKE